MSEEWGNMARLRVLGECLADAKRARVSAQNRALRGAVLVPDTSSTDPDAVKFEQQRLMAPALAVEASYEKELIAVYRETVPDYIQEWAAGIPGLASGALFPRIIAGIGHPRIAIPYRWDTNDKGQKVTVPDGDPFERTLQQLWQYAGCGDPMSRPRSDILGHSPTQADMLRGGKRESLRPLLYTFSSYLVRMKGNEKIGESFYYKVFEEARAAAEAKVHERQCQNKKRPPFAPDGCGTVAHPEWGAPGSPWRPGHMNMHAHRMVQKELLRGLWVVAGK